VQLHGYRSARARLLSAKPIFIRDFGLVGQQPGAGGAVPMQLHGVMSSGVKGNRIYF